MKGKQDKATADYHRGAATADAFMAIFGLKRVETEPPQPQAPSNTMDPADIDKYQTEYENIWIDFYDGACPSGKQRDRALAALAKQFPAEAALHAAREANST